MDIRNYSKVQLEELLKNSTSYSNFLNKIGYAKSGTGYKTTQSYLKSVGVDFTIVSSIRWSSIEKTKEETFILGSNLNSSNLKNKILKYNLIDYKCSICDNNGEWKGKKLSLHLDHINGISNDNRLVNLRFLCPNCHSQTDTYAGKNKLFQKN